MALSRSPVRNLSQLQREDCENQKLSWDAGNLEDYYYILTPLQTNHQAIKEINMLFFHFLWNDKKDKIKRSIMINDYPARGRKMIDISSFNK